MKEISGEMKFTFGMSTSGHCYFTAVDQNGIQVTSWAFSTYQGMAKIAADHLEVYILSQFQLILEKE